MTRRINSTSGSVGLLAVVFVLWIVSMARLQLSAIGTYGLVSAFPATMYIGLALLSVSMVMAIHRDERQSVLAAHLVLFILMVHGTPALVYGVLRYAWAWKHLGLIDYLVHHRVVSPHSGGDQVVYHNWPGFFTTTTTWFVGSGLKSWSGMAQWAPAVFELLFSFAAFTLLRAIETDRRVVWLAVWFFALGNWVGQDYFSPQAFVYFLYLAVFALVFRSLARRPALPRLLKRFVRAGADAPLSPFLGGEVGVAGQEGPSREQTRATVILVLLLVTAIATSHPLTPVLMLAVLAVLAVTGVLRVRTLPVMAAVPVLLWIATGARTYTSANTQILLAKFGKLDSNINSGLSKAANAVQSQKLVSNLGRLEVAFMIMLAGIGLIRRIRSGHWDLGMMVLAGVPVTILAGNSYGGEALFRVYLFSLPFLAFFAAASVYPSKRSGGAPAAWFATLCCAVLVVTFLFAYYGKEGWTYFTRGEERAAETIFSRATPHSLLVDGTPDYPTHFKNYTDFTYVDIASEPLQSYNAVLKDPVTQLYVWLSDLTYSNAYLIITRSQKAESEALGELPPGALAKIERALLASPRFQVLYHDADATVFTVPHPPQVSQPETQVP